MKVTKEELLRENVVYHCNTEEKANELLTKADSLGLRWDDENRYTFDNEWRYYKKDTCYRFSEAVRSEKSFYEKHGYEIIEYKLDETNFEHYKNELLEISKTSDIAVMKETGMPARCKKVGCKRCIFHARCGVETLFDWGFSEYEPYKIKLTKTEYKLLNAVGDDLELLESLQADFKMFDELDLSNVDKILNNCEVLGDE